MYLSSNHKAFTLVELLVAIAIIGILATLTVVNLSNAKAKARDAQRLSDMRQIWLALQLYYEDNGVYPEEDRDAPLPPDFSTIKWESSLNPNWLDELVTGGYFANNVPADPLNKCEDCAFGQRRNAANENYIYDYQHRGPTPGDGPEDEDWFCTDIENQEMFILGIRTLETIPRPTGIGILDHTENHPGSPGFDCGTFGDDFNLRFDWVVSNLYRGF